MNKMKQALDQAQLNSNSALRKFGWSLVFSGVLVVSLIVSLLTGHLESEKPTPPFTSTIYLDKNYEGERFGGDSIYYLEVQGPDTGFVTPLSTAWECSQGY